MDRRALRVAASVRISRTFEKEPRLPFPILLSNQNRGHPIFQKENRACGTLVPLVAGGNHTL